MSAVGNAVRQGVQRGGRELRQTVTTGQDLANNLVWLVSIAVPVLLLRDDPMAGTGLSAAHFVLPGLMSVCVAFNGMLGLAQQLVVEREDGTLLRLKALPHGMLSYLVGKVLAVSCTVLVACGSVLLTGVLVLEGPGLGAPGAWPALVWLLPLGLVATLPIGAAVGSLVESPRSIGLVMLPVFALVSVSGVFYPVNALPGWLQFTAQLFPLYWLGLGARAALLPDSAAVAEIGASWRVWETAGVLGLWAVAGMLAAPALLRRMARRESGSAVAARRERALQRSM